MTELKKILHVEDDPDILRLVKVALERVGGYEVECHESAPDAIASAPDFDPDLILLDVMMPVMNGVDAYHAFRDVEQTAETPIIFLTAKAELEMVGELVELGAIDVILKPFDPMTLSEKIGQIWAKHVD